MFTNFGTFNNCKTSKFIITSNIVYFESNIGGVRLNNNFVEDDIYNIKDKLEIILPNQNEIPILLNYPNTTKQIFYIKTKSNWTREELASKITRIYDLMYNNETFYFDDNYNKKDDMILIGLQYYNNMYIPILELYI
jgi:hypothetical protein